MKPENKASRGARGGGEQWGGKEKDIEQYSSVGIPKSLNIKTLPTSNIYIKTL